VDAGAAGPSIYSASSGGHQPTHRPRAGPSPAACSSAPAGHWRLCVCVFAGLAPPTAPAAGQDNMMGTVPGPPNAVPEGVPPAGTARPSLVSTRNNVTHGTPPPATALLSPERRFTPEMLHPSLALSSDGCLTRRFGASMSCHTALCGVPLGSTANSMLEPHVFECDFEIRGRRSRSSVVVGVASVSGQQRLWRTRATHTGHGWGYHSWSGDLCHRTIADPRSGKMGFPKWRGQAPAARGDVIRLALDVRLGTLTVYKNSVRLGVMVRDQVLKGRQLCWMVELDHPGDAVRVLGGRSHHGAQATAMARRQQRRQSAVAEADPCHRAATSRLLYVDPSTPLFLRGTQSLLRRGPQRGRSIYEGGPHQQPMPSPEPEPEPEPVVRAVVTVPEDGLPCPITLAPMARPYLARCCGQRFEEEALHAWLAVRANCPLCRAPITAEMLGPSTAPGTPRQ
jgi:hypothetical protein